MLRKNTNRPRTSKDAGKIAPTELLILALVAHGHARTLYALQKETFLSAGALVPALRKLMDKGLLRSEEPGLRGRLEFQVPQSKAKEIEEKWKATAKEHIGDCDAVLKLCKAAEIFDLPEAVDLASSALQLRTAELRNYTNPNGQRRVPQIDPYNFRSFWDVARFYKLQAEEQTLREVKRALESDL